VKFKPAAVSTFVGVNVKEVKVILKVEGRSNKGTVESSSI
jgi:hypothetical protein